MLPNLLVSPTKIEGQAAFVPPRGCDRHTTTGARLNCGIPTGMDTTGWQGLKPDLGFRGVPPFTVILGNSNNPTRHLADADVRRR